MENVRRIGLGLLAASLLSNTALAQIRPPSSTQPGQVQQNLEEKPERPEVGGAPLITTPEPTVKKTNSSVTFTLKDIEFENLTAFKKEDLLPDYQEYLGKKISLDTLNEIANKITIQYRNKGYILSRAVVPPQHIESGTVKIRIVEGYINKVNFEGNVAESGLLAKYANKIRSARPLDAKTLERYLLLINDLPGVSAHAVLVPAEGAPGASDVIVTVNERRVDGSATVNNRGTRYMGPIQFGLTADLNNAFGNFDRTQFHGVQTAEFNELHYGQISHDEELDSEGTKLTLAYTYTNTHPAFNQEALGLDGNDWLYSAQVSHPFIRSRQENLYGNVEFDIHDSDVHDFDYAGKLYDDHMRTLRIGGSYDFIDYFSAVNKIDATVAHGFNWDASSDDSSSRPGTGADSTYTKINGTISHLQQIHGPFDLYVAATGQYSADTLFLAEQFGLGGESFGSAYDPSELTGDSGAAARAEIRYNRANDWNFVPHYQLYGFYDVGSVWNRDTFTDPERTSLADAGFGLRFNAIDNLSGSFEFAAPLTKVVTADGPDSYEGYRPRVFFALEYRY